jgi:hypothetical protein
VFGDPRRRYHQPRGILTVDFQDPVFHHSADVTRFETGTSLQRPSRSIRRRKMSRRVSSWPQTLRHGAGMYLSG